MLCLKMFDMRAHGGSGTTTTDLLVSGPIFGKEG